MAAEEAGGAANWTKVGTSLALGIAALASAFGLGRAVSAAMEAIARQPEAGPQIQTAMIIGCALIEALTIYVLVTVFIFQGRIAG